MESVNFSRLRAQYLEGKGTEVSRLLELSYQEHTELDNLNKFIHQTLGNSEMYGFDELGIMCLKLKSARDSGDFEEVKFLLEMILSFVESHRVLSETIQS